jgi:hypothetical protein
MIDKMTRFERWKSAQGRKTISFEEYSLLHALGIDGFYPQTLVLESCVELIRLLINSSSDFSQSSIMSQVDEFSFSVPIRLGDVLSISASIITKDERTACSECRVHRDGQAVGAGQVTVELFSLEQTAERELTRTIWKEAYDTLRNKDTSIRHEEERRQTRNGGCETRC